MKAKLLLKPIEEWSSESTGVNRAIPTAPNKTFLQIMRELMEKFGSTVNCDSGDLYTDVVSIIRKKIKESFLGDEPLKRPDTAGISADASQGKDVDTMWSKCGLRDWSENYMYYSHMAIGDHVVYCPDPNVGYKCMITAITFTIEGPVLYDLITIGTDTQTKFHKVSGVCLHIDCHAEKAQLHRIIGTIGDQLAKEVAAATKMGEKHAWEHFIHRSIDDMAEFAKSRLIDFDLAPLECVMLFIFIVSRRVEIWIEEERYDSRY